MVLALYKNLYPSRVDPGNPSINTHIYVAYICMYARVHIQVHVIYIYDSISAKVKRAVAKAEDLAATATAELR